MRSAAGQTTVEYAGVCLLVLVLVLGLAAAASGRGHPRPRGDAAALALARRYTPTLVLERGGDEELPVDFRSCRRIACATRPAARPVLFVHAVSRRGFRYLEYWEYLPDSRFAHTGLGPIDGYHRDDWEGVIVKLAPDGSVVGARASAHLGWNGRRAWWDLAADDWAPYPAPVYRAAGSHAGSFSQDGIDLAGDRWDGAARSVRPELVPADAAAQDGARFDPGSVPPWEKLAWSDPEAVTTGRPADGARYARLARWWARLCVICGW
jgi:hypothetical protein